MSRRSSIASREVLPLAEQFWELRADYQAGKDSRFLPRVKGVQRTGSGHDYHLRSEPEYFYMMERARSFDRDNLVAGQGINRLVANVLQKGMSLDVQTADEGLNTELATRFWDWGHDADQVDAEGEKCFNSMAELALRHQIVDGDDVFLFNREGTMQAVEGHRLRTPSSTRDKRVFAGIRKDAFGKRLEYWVTKKDLDPFETLKTQDDIEKYPVRDKQGQRLLAHVYDPKRFSQTRGVTAFATMCYALSLEDDIQFATLVKQQVAACFAVIRELPEFIEGAPPAPARDADAKAATGATRQESLDDGTVRTIQGIGPGMDIRGNPGEKLQLAAPNIPSPEFVPHALLVLQFVSVNLDLPLQVFLLDPTKTNFSGWRGAIDQARLRFQVIQEHLVERFYKPVYQWKVRQFAADDPAIRKRLAAADSGKGDVNLLSHVWNPPAWRYIEPLKDAQSDTLRLRENLISERRRAAEQGLDGEDLMKECVDDRAKRVLYAKEKADELNGQGADVTWRELAGGEFLESKVVNTLVAAREAPEPAAGGAED